MSVMRVQKEKKLEKVFDSFFFNENGILDEVL